MKCTEFEDRLNEVLDLRLSPDRDAALQSHAESCGECRELLAAQEQLFSGLALTVRAQRVPEIGPRVLTELRPVSVSQSSLPLSRESRRWNWLTLLASAAAVILAVSFGVWVANQRTAPNQAGVGGDAQQGRNNGLAMAKPGAPRGKSKATPTPNGPSIPQPEEAIAHAPAATVDPTPSPTLPEIDRNSEAYRQAMETFATHLQHAGHWPPVESLNVQQVEQYAPSIRPIRESFEVALDALLKTLPGKKDTARPSQPQAQQHAEDLLRIA